MCSTCGCGNTDDGVQIMVPGQEHVAHNSTSQSLLLNNPHSGGGQRYAPTGELHIKLEKNILDENDRLAAGNRVYLKKRGAFAVNLVSSPGSGKTTLLERTIGLLSRDVPMAIIEGDQQSMNDANRIAATGAPVVQINTGQGCHLDAHMVLHGMQRLEIQENSILFIENVGNLVCPALFDLGENRRVVIASVTEGDDKPVKYPYMFQSSHICIINKIDLLPYVNFSLNAFRDYVKRINPSITFFEVSATTGRGMDQWTAWLLAQVTKPVVG